MSDLIVSYIRTGVPVAVGAFLSWLITIGVEINTDAQSGLVTAITAIVIAVYYAGARFAERRWPRVGGFLLGRRVEPTYSNQ